MTELKANRQYKDRVFRMIFNSREKLLELYNAMNGTDYESAEDLEIVTLENTVYMNIKNDMAFLVDFWLNLYNHQATRNPNMPLRDLFYVAKEYMIFVEQVRKYAAFLELNKAV